MSRPAQQIKAYGEWKSRITSDHLVHGNCKAICELQVRNGTPFWVEQTFPAGVRVLFEDDKENTKTTRWSPEGISVINSVHEYGGGSFYVGDHTNHVIVCQKGGLFALDKPNTSIRPIVDCSPEIGKDIRHADPYVHGDYVYAVREEHNVGEGTSAEPKNLIIQANINSLNRIRVVAEGADFYAEPRVSPSGKHIAWIQWNSPYMPWDRTSVHVAEISADGNICMTRKLLEGSAFFGLQWERTSYQQRLYVISDLTGYWNLYTIDINKCSLGENVYPIDRDIGGPLWQFADDRPFCVHADDGIVIAVGNVLLHRRSEDGEFKCIEPVKEAGFSVFSFLTISGGHLFCIAAGPKRSFSLIDVNLENHSVGVIREVRSAQTLNEMDISTGESKRFNSDGVTVEGYFYPPTNSEYAAPENTLPPVILFAHPGPTMQTTNAFDIKKQYFTSKGFAIFDINYRGSSGYGTVFRNLLLGNWGIVDTNDMINGAKQLINEGLVDPQKICIYGSSAGGFLVLSVLYHPENVVSAAVSVYGVTDLVDLFKATHKFESGYTIRLIAPYPEGAEVYRQRSPLSNIDKINIPVAFLHGTTDPVVPYSQSQLCFEKLKNKGIPTSLTLFQGEGHGFKTTEAITKTVDITYFFFCKILGITPSMEIDVIFQQSQLSSGNSEFEERNKKSLRDYNSNTETHLDYSGIEVLGNFIIKFSPRS